MHSPHQALGRLSLAISVALALATMVSTTSSQTPGLKCLTGNAPRDADNAGVDGTYSILMPGLITHGWPEGPPQRDVPFSQGALTDGDENTLLEWDDREFGSLGRDIVLDLGADYFLDRVEVRCKGNRLTGGTLYLRQQDGEVFVPVGTYGPKDFPTDEDRRRGRYLAVLFHGVNGIARHLRINVRGNHEPRFAELQIWGRAVRPGDSRDLQPLLPYDPASLSEPKPVKQVTLRHGLAAIVPRPRELKASGGSLRTRLTLRPGHVLTKRDESAIRFKSFDGKRETGAPWEAPGGYELIVTPGGIELTGFDEAGLRNGVRTLAQIIAEDGTVPCCEIRDWPHFAFRAVRKVPPNREDGAFNERYIRALAALKYNRVVHEGLYWAVNFESWKTGYSKAISAEKLKDAIEFNESLGLATSGGWGIAPATWVMQLGDPSLVEARPGEAYLKDGRIEFKRYPGEILRRMSRVNACPLQPRNFEVFRQAVNEVCYIYTDEYFFGGVDEPLQWYNGSRWGCCELCCDHDPVQLMADWVKKCSDHIRKTHRRIHMYQTTIILKEHQGEEPGYPGGPAIPMYEIIDQLPKDRVALINWSYGVWKRKKDEPDSSNLNRYLASKGYRQIIQNVGYTDASFAICDFTKWAGQRGADFIGATVANYGSQTLEDMARRFKFLDYVVAAEELWSARTPEASALDMASHLVNGLELVREIVQDTKLPSRRARPTDCFTVDIRVHANRSTTDEKPFDGRGWLDLGPGLDLRALPRGPTELCGQLFQLIDPNANGGRSCVMIENAQRGDRSLPSEVKGIAIGKRAASLVFLHAVTGSIEASATQPAFVYRIDYADGAGAEFPVRYRIEAMEWLDQSDVGPGDMRIGWLLYGARPAWLGTTASGQRVIIYAAEWVNPHPGKVIRTIDMVLPDDSSAPGAALFAISGVAAI